MLLTDKNKMAATIIAGMGKKEDEEAPKSEEGGELDASPGLESAAEELLAAIESKSTKGIVEAIKSMIELANEPEEAGEYPTEA